MRAALALALLACACAPKRWLALDEKDLAPGVWPEASAERLLDETTVRFRLEQGRVVLEHTEHLATRLLDGGVDPGRPTVAHAGDDLLLEDELRIRPPPPESTPGDVVPAGGVCERRVGWRTGDDLRLVARVPLRVSVPTRERRLVVEAPTGWEVDVTLPDRYQVTPNVDRRGGKNLSVYAWFQLPPEEPEPLQSERDADVVVQLLSWTDASGPRRAPADFAALSRALAGRLGEGGERGAARPPSLPELRTLLDEARAHPAQVPLHARGLAPEPELGVALSLTAALRARGVDVRLGFALPSAAAGHTLAGVSLDGLSAVLLSLRDGDETVLVDPRSPWPGRVPEELAGAPVVWADTAGASLGRIPMAAPDAAVRSLRVELRREGEQLSGAFEREWYGEVVGAGVALPPCTAFLSAPCTQDAAPVDPERVVSRGRLTLAGAPLTLGRIRVSVPLLPADRRREHGFWLGPARTERFVLRLEGARLDVEAGDVDTPYLRSSVRALADGAIERVDLWKLSAVAPCDAAAVRAALEAAHALDERPITVR
ncbi:MAG: hypothetical protein K1X89_22850 [Myxococcaceae bacterium]|nr:hypothetical protein [Myxococcaceae bacterium]